MDVTPPPPSGRTGPTNNDLPVAPRKLWGTLQRLCQGMKDVRNYLIKKKVILFRIGAN